MTTDGTSQYNAKTYDGKNIKVGDRVFQLSFGKGEHYIVTYIVEEITDENQVRLSVFDPKIDNLKQQSDIPSATVHSDRRQLVKENLDGMVSDLINNVIPRINGLNHLYNKLSYEYSPIVYEETTNEEI